MVGGLVEGLEASHVTSYLNLVVTLRVSKSPVILVFVYITPRQRDRNHHNASKPSLLLATVHVQDSGFPGFHSNPSIGTSQIDVLRNS
jgi:hypothetical protein